MSVLSSTSTSIAVYDRSADQELNNLMNKFRTKLLYAISCSIRNYSVAEVFLP